MDRDSASTSRHGKSELRHPERRGVTDLPAEGLLFHEPRARDDGVGRAGGCIESKCAGLPLWQRLGLSRASHRRAALGDRLRARGGTGQRQHGGRHVLRLRGLERRDLLGHLPALHGGLDRQHVPRHRRNVRGTLDLWRDHEARPVESRQLLHDGPLRPHPCVHRQYLPRQSDALLAHDVRRGHRLRRTDGLRHRQAQGAGRASR